VAARRSVGPANRARQEIARIREAIAAVDYLCMGSIQRRMTTCGKSSCRCSVDPQARHGPYYTWTQTRNSRQFQRYVSAQQAKTLRAAIANYRMVKKLLREWDAQTERLIEAEEAPIA
jgi:hypothetical protein